ncbi:hypothetical protein H6F74_21510 [Trichocoleus sp. FACHB-90]|uniref:hypothetical protein n=1 Tax=Cyanophyceae TaxID=3028117 RepID=UPI00168A396E|nr:hypothetical protein [Trichocoleus sp. FACHB-90]MBD1928801.1 hypothetical protein [Trichocoleus sp. FACHB-90]
MPSLVPRIPIGTAFWFLPFTHYKEAVLRSLATPTSSYKRFHSLRSDQPEIALPRIESKQAFKKAFKKAFRSDGVNLFDRRICDRRALPIFAGT